MKIRSFTTLAALNEFLVSELGAPAITEAELPDEVRQALADDAAIMNVRVEQEETVSGPSFEGIDLSSILGQIFGAEEADAEDAAEQEAGSAPEATVSQELFDSYVEFTSKQIVRIVEERDQAIAQRDEARGVAEAEIDAHTQCHEHMAEHIHQIRTQGYAEAVAAGLFPGVPFERLDDNQQEVLMRQATQSIENIDAIRAEYATFGTTKH